LKSEFGNQFCCMTLSLKVASIDNSIESEFEARFCKTTSLKVSPDHHCLQHGFVLDGG
jgi:hypothetical protein